MEQINDMVVNLRDMAANNSTRILICICIDASNSMNQRMKEINRGVMQFLQGIADNICAADAAEICVYSFGSKVRMLCDYGNIQKAIDMMEESGGIQANEADSNMGEFIEASLEILNRHRQQLLDLSKSFYRPWLIIISDGDATDPSACDRVSEKVRTMLRQRKLKVKCLSMGEGLYFRWPGRSFGRFEDHGLLFNVESQRFSGESGKYHGWRRRVGSNPETDITKIQMITHLNKL